MITIGTKRYTFKTTVKEKCRVQSRYFTLPKKETDSIPISVNTLDSTSHVVAIEIKCKRTDREYKKWQLETHATILQAYQQKQSEYEEKLNELEMQIGVNIEGRHPEENRKLEKVELKKACISILSLQHFDQFDSIDEGSQEDPTVPQVDIDEAKQEGKFIRFFEQAFEWENMTYVFYPYFWGRKDKWVERMNYQDVDPLFESFLKAGAARVVVPVRPTPTQRGSTGGTEQLGFVAALDHFMTTGELPDDNEATEIGSELYVPIIEEYKEQLGAPGNEVAVEPPWEVIIPTSLVMLRNDSSLPKWKKDENGNWVSDADQKSEAQNDQTTS